MDDKQLTSIGEQHVVRQKGRGGVDNFNSNKRDMLKTDEQRMMAGQLLTETLHAYRMEKVTNDDELAERLDRYFSMCAEKEIVPTVEEMCLYTGYAISTVWDWETGRRGGFSSQTAEIIKKAKDFMKTFDAKMVVSGQLNFLAYCFRAKNYYGMQDKQELVLTPNTPLGDTLTPEEIQSKYQDMIEE